MIKLLFLVSTLKNCGPTNQLFNILKNLDSSVFEPILITLSSEGKDSRLRDYKSLGIKIHSLKLSRFSGIFFAMSRLKSLIYKIQPDLIHTQGIRPDVLSSCLNYSLPRISTIRNFPQNDFPMTYGKFLGAIMVYLQVAALKKFNTCVGVSNAVSDNLINNFGLNHSICIPNGIDTETYFPVDHKVKLKLREKLGLPLEQKIWIISGDLIERKNPIFLINSWKRYFLNDSDHCLVLLGDGALMKPCVQLGNDVKNIKVIGRSTNVSEYLQASDFYLSASKAEGMPNAALEALACGLPLLLSDIGPHSEIINMDPRIGLTYEIDSHYDFSLKIKRLINSDYNEMRDACFDIVRAHLSATVMSKNYQSLYINLMSKI